MAKLISNGNGEGCWHHKCRYSAAESDGEPVEVTECLACGRVWHRTQRDLQIWGDLMFSTYADRRQHG